jgi:hypothetical protein
LKRNKQKLLAVASRQNVSWDGGGGGFNDPGPKPKYRRLCPGIQIVDIFQFLLTLINLLIKHNFKRPNVKIKQNCNVMDI